MHVCIMTAWDSGMLFPVDLGGVRNYSSIAEDSVPPPITIPFSCLPIKYHSRETLFCFYSLMFLLFKKKTKHDVSNILYN